ncbi:MAG: ABC transporter substrate-binding protein [Chloroflexi bacterium]|nr:ABC transporter substrate-binding protein [Chloroflexota bacterium]
MPIKRISLTLMLILLFISTAIVVTAQDEVARADTVIFDIDDSAIPNPTNFNWMVPGTRRNTGAHQALWEPLFILNYETGQIDPWLGVSFTPNEAQDVWTLKLREGIKWSDGEAFNADDVVFTINLLLGDETATLAEAANMQQWIESVEKIDDLTVQFNLKAPNPRFQLDYFSVRIWGGVVILPEHIWAGQDPFTFTFFDLEKGWPVGTGPYRLVSSTTTETIWDRRDDWWGAETGWMPLPEPLRLIWVITGAEENKALLMSDGQLDSAMDMTLGAFEAVQAQNPNVIAWYDDLPYAWPDPCARQLSLNNAVPPWDNKDLRKAVSLIIDRNQIVEVAYEGTSVPSKTMFVQYGAMSPYIDAIVGAGMGINPEADVAAGQALIEGAGYTRNADGFYEKDGEVLAVDIISDETGIEYTRIVNVVVEQLRAAGIEATARPVASATWIDARTTGNFSGVFDWEACGSINEPWNSMNRYTNHWVRPLGERTPGDNNFVRWNTENTAKYTEIVDQIGVLPLGDPQIVDMVVEAYRYMYEETPIIPLTQAKKLVPFDTTYWTGWPSAENNYNHPATWWQSTHQIIHNLRHAQ